MKKVISIITAIVTVIICNGSYAVSEYSIPVWSPQQRESSQTIQTSISATTETSNPY